MTASLPTNQRPDASVRDYIVPALSGLMVALGTAYPILTIGCLLMNVAYILLARPAAVYMLLFSLMPFALVYKVASFSGVSFFTILELLVVVVYTMKLRHFRKSFLMFLAVWAVYILLGSSSDPMEWLKQILFPLLVYLFFNYERPTFKQVILSLTLGLLLSSVMATFSEHIPELTAMIRLSRVWGVDDIVYRFSGLYPDPNYYSQELILSIVSLLGLYAYRQIDWKAIILAGILTYFGIQTASKSFILMLITVVLIFLLMLVRNKRNGEAILVLLAGAVVVILVATGRIGIFNNMLVRLREGDFTTGRTRIWGRYMTYFGDNMLRFLFGSGLTAGYYRGLAAHNSYIDLFYYYGLCGTTVLAGSVLRAVRLRREKRLLMNYVPLLCLMAMNMFLSCVTFFDFPFNIILVLYALQVDFRGEDTGLPPNDGE